MAARTFKKGGRLSFKQGVIVPKRLFDAYGFTGSDRTHMDTLIGQLLTHRGKETEIAIKTRLSRNWSPGISSTRPFPALRAGRLQQSIGYMVFQRGGATVMASGIMVKVPLAHGQLPPTIWGRFQEYGHVVKMSNPAKPFFYIPIPTGPAVGPEGQIDKSWMPGIALREKLKTVGRNVGARAFYFPSPISKSAAKRVIFIAAIRWEHGKAKFVIPPTPIAVGVRQFRIPQRPYLRPAWDQLYNSRGTGTLNKDIKLTSQELGWVLKGGLRGNTLAEYEDAVIQVVVQVKL